MASVDQTETLSHIFSFCFSKKGLQSDDKKYFFVVAVIMVTYISKIERVTCLSII
jgi:hypothetical protein